MQAFPLNATTCHQPSAIGHESPPISPAGFKRTRADLRRDQITKKAQIEYIENKDRL
jgi:hypothetical protein